MLPPYLLWHVVLLWASPTPHTILAVGSDLRSVHMVVTIVSHEIVNSSFRIRVGM